MIRESLVREATDVQRRPVAPSLIARMPNNRNEPELSRVTALRQRAGNQGIQRLMGKRAELGRTSGAAPAARSIPIQTKLAINEPGDAHEREADRVADAVICACA
jgi:hypothetical protein